MAGSLPDSVATACAPWSRTGRRATLYPPSAGLRSRRCRTSGGSPADVPGQVSVAKAQLPGLFDRRSAQ